MVLFKCLCIIRPAVIPSVVQQSVALEHWHPVLFQAADSVPSLVPNPELGLVSSLVPRPVPNLCLWAVRVDSNFLVQIGPAAYRDLVCLYLRGHAVPANYSFPSPGGKYFCVGNLYCLCLVLRGLCRLCLLQVHVELSCPGAHSPGHTGLNLCLENHGRNYRVLFPVGLGRIHSALCLDVSVCFGSDPGPTGNMVLVVPGSPD
jgi:hypothetical protein